MSNDRHRGYDLRGREVRSEFKTIGALGLLYAFRMLGLFMVAPVLVIFGTEYAGATPGLLGLAMGAAGFTQALFLIPLGLLSDRFNRKLVVALGFAVFALGSLVAALSSSIEGLIIGRVLQGAGAVGGAILALVADLTSEQNRTRSMAAVGASIGLSFALAMIVGPVIAGVGGLAAVFTVACILAVLAIVVLYGVVPNPSPATSGVPHDRQISHRLLSLAFEPNLASLNFGIFVLHAVFTGSLMVVPTLLRDVVGVPAADHWQVYVPALLSAFVLMLPVMLVVERKQWVKPAVIAAVALLAASLGGMMSTGNGKVMLLLTLFLLFLAFNFLEATLPSLASKSAPAAAKGSVMGMFTTCQSLGIFTGGLGAGILLELYGQQGVFVGAIVITAAWLLVAALAMPVRRYTDRRVIVPPGFDKRSGVLDNLSLTGIKKACYVREESAVYLRIDESSVDPRQLESLVASLEEEPV